MRRNRNLALKLVAFSVLLSVFFLGVNEGTVAQTVNGFRMPANPYYNPYTGPYYSGSYPGSGSRGSSYGTMPSPSRSMAYRPPVQKPFSNVPVRNGPLVSSEDYARTMILRTTWW